MLPINIECLFLDPREINTNKYVYIQVDLIHSLMNGNQWIKCSHNWISQMHLSYKDYLGAPFGATC